MNYIPTTGFGSVTHTYQNGKVSHIIVSENIKPKDEKELEDILEKSNLKPKIGELILSFKDGKITNIKKNINCLPS